MPNASQVDRVVWMLWLQGFEKSPEVVRVCLHTWKTRNPGWKVIELSDENLADYIDSSSLSVLRSLDINRQKLANLIRMYLISRQGGVWVDATCFCCQPLDNWLDDYMASGFFAFRDPGPDRILANWFLAAKKGNLLASTFYEQHRDFFQKNEFPLQKTEKGRKRARRLGRILNLNSRLAQLWTYPLLIRTVKAYPYMIFHYHFARTVRENEVCREIWSKTPFLSARGPLKMRASLLSPMTDEQMDDLRKLKDPLYKLNWHYRKADVTPGCVLDQIMRSVV